MGVEGSGFKGSGFRVQGLGFGVQVLEFRVRGLRLAGIKGHGFLLAAIAE